MQSESTIPNTDTSTTRQNLCLFGPTLTHSPVRFLQYLHHPRPRTYKLLPTERGERHIYVRAPAPYPPRQPPPPPPLQVVSSAVLGFHEKDILMFHQVVILPGTGLINNDL